MASSLFSLGVTLTRCRCGGKSVNSISDFSQRIIVFFLINQSRTVPHPQLML